MLLRRRYDEDDVDRLNRIWTVLTFVVLGLSVIVYVAVFPDAAVTCLPVGDSDFSAERTRYANMYCLDESVFPPRSWVDVPFSYHMFIPLFMFYQALAFLSPHLLAQLMKHLFGSSSEFLFLYAQSKRFDMNVFSDRVAYPPPASVKSTVTFLVKKVLYLINSLLQLTMVATFFSPDKSLSGLHDETHKGASSTPFPRYGRCRLDIEDEPTLYFQCTFHINGILHKIYLVLFYWLLVVTLANLLSLVTWFLLLFVPSMTSNKIETYTLSRGDTDETPSKTRAFVKDHLGRDFLLYLLLAQSTEREATAADLTLQLWKAYVFPLSAQSEIETK